MTQQEEMKTILVAYLKRKSTKYFTRQGLMEDKVFWEGFLQMTESNTPEQRLSRNLQHLRDEFSCVEFLGYGKYLYTQSL